MARTPNYNLELIDFNKIPWHTKEHDNWRSIDAIFANFITVNQMQGVWQNATDVTVGQRFVDAEEGTILTVLIAHTTASTGLFAADRIANPTFWDLFSEVALAESWATSLAGLVNGIDFSSKAYAIGTVTQLPDGSAKRWAIEVEDTVVLSGSYSALHHATKAAASAVSSAADAVTTLTTGTTNLEVADARDYYILNAAGGTITINLPAIGDSDGLLFGFQVSNVDNAISIVRDGTDRINGNAANYSDLTTVGQVVHFIGDNASPDNWLATIISQVSAASATQAGVIELATNAETLTGTATNRAVTPANTKATYSGILRTINAQTGTTYTFVLADAGKIVTSSNSSAQTITIPPNSGVAFAVGTQIDIYNLGAGIASITGGSGVTLNGVSTGTGAMNAQYAAVTIFKTATNTWLMTGAHGAVA